MEQTTITINGKETTVRYLSFDKFCSKFYEYIHTRTIADMQEDYESARSQCSIYRRLSVYNDQSYCNYSFYKTVLLYITSQSPAISSMYDVYKADRLKGGTITL